MYAERKNHHGKPVEQMFDGDIKPDQETTDKQKMHERHTSLMECLKDERDRQGPNRIQMAKDEDCFDSLQWEPEDAAELMERGQAPLVFNKVKPVCNWILGTEKRTRIDGKVLPREETDQQMSEVKTKLLKYLSDVNRTPFSRSAAFKEAVIAGVGWLEDGINPDPDDELIYSGWQSWRNVIHDSRAKDLDCEDGRYQFIEKITDADIVASIFPDAMGEIDLLQDEKMSFHDDVWYVGSRLTNSTDQTVQTQFGDRSGYISTSNVDHGRRSQVRLLRCEYKVYEACQYFATGPYQGRPIDRSNQQHAELLKGGAATFQHPRSMMRMMICTEGMPLWDGPSPYKHNKFSLTPIWCYRRARDLMPYGVVRDIRDIQDDFNKRRSKALWILSSNRIRMTSDAVLPGDIENLRLEAARPNGIVVHKQGSELSFEKNMAEVSGNLEMMQQDDVMLSEVSGVTPDLQGQQTNAQSGKAVLARQNQGSMVTASIFDNLRMAVQIQGEKQLSLCEQFMTQKKVLRLVGNNRPIEWVQINGYDPETGQYVNDITASKADFVVSEQDFRASLMQGAAEQIGDVLQKIAGMAPQIAISVLDLWIEMLDVPNKEDFVQRIRKINGQTDPSKQPTPQDIQAAQDGQAQQKKLADLQMAKLEAEVAKIKAQGGQVDAQSFKSLVEGLYASIQAGQVIAANPEAAGVADSIAQGAGFVDKQGADPNIPQLPAQQMQQPLPMQDKIPREPVYNTGIETPQLDGVQP